jgi:glycosyltransferase involved in cell wall biosynthesis
MKILQIIDSLNTAGAEKLLLEMIPLLVKKGIEVDLLVLDGKQYPYMKQLQQLKCCNIYSLGQGSLLNPLHIFKIIPYLNRYDLIHVHLFPAQYWVVFAKILSFSKVKLIFTEHSTSNRRIQKKYFKYIERFVYSFYSKIICITDEVKQVFEVHTKLNSKRFLVITNGVNLTAINESVAYDRNTIYGSSINRDDKIIIQVAGFRIEKDQKTVIRAMQYLETNVKLLLVGDGSLRKECEQLVKELNLLKRVFFLSVRTDVPSLLKTADISVVSSNWEGFGLVAVEGMASKKPVIASDVAGLSTVVKGAGVLFEKGNDKELAKTIHDLLADEDYYNKVVKAGFERAKQYDINSMVDKQIKLYRELLK